MISVSTVASNKTKHGGVIPVNPAAKSRRTVKVPGRGPAPLGRPLKNQSDRVQVTVTEEDDLLSKSDKPTTSHIKKKHDLTQTIKNNESLPKNHTKQGI